MLRPARRNVVPDSLWVPGGALRPQRAGWEGYHLIVEGVLTVLERVLTGFLGWDIEHTRPPADLCGAPNCTLRRPCDTTV